MAVALGISGRGAHASIALAADGRVVAAVTEGMVTRGPAPADAARAVAPDAAVEACLRRAGVAIGDVSHLVVASSRAAETAGDPRWRTLDLGRSVRGLDGVAPSVKARLVTPDEAQAWAGAAGTKADRALVVCVRDGARPSGAVFLKSGGTLERRSSIDGVCDVLSAARAVASAVGEVADTPMEALERLAARGPRDGAPLLERAIAFHSPAGFTTDRATLDGALARCKASVGDALADPDSPNVRVQEKRRALAADFLESVTAALALGIDDWCRRQQASTVVLAGSLFASDALNTRLADRLEFAVEPAPVPEEAGSALGAALAAGAHIDAGLRDLALGPVFSESEVKTTLENCRLDYLYEPNWERLLARVSGLLNRGQTVAWCQGPADFGPRSLGSRSLLLDASGRYARENLNRYMLQRAVDHPLAVSMREDDAQETLEGRARSPYMLLRGEPREAWRDRFRAAMDRSHRFAVHTVADGHPSRLDQLLYVHRARTGVPGLVNHPLTLPGDFMACAPRDAIRTFFSSAVDALVFDRFLVMKDYWLLRGDVTA